MSDTQSADAKWYLSEPRRFEFEARVVARPQRADGLPAVVLDRTCFYPTSGGQPHDRGTLNDIAVIDVTEDDAGRVVHHLGAPLNADVVHGVIDAERRLDHMQQHSGQHLLSAACVRVFERETVSFHLGADACSIDLPGAPFDAEQYAVLESEANRVVWQARRVHVRTFGAEQCEQLRKPPPGNIDAVRVIEIDDWDLSPCCGTHVERTSDIGCIKLLAQERVRDRVRLHFACGARALRHFERALKRQADLVRQLTCHPDEIAARVDQLVGETRRLRKERAVLRAELATLQARTWLADAPLWAGRPVVVRRLDEAEALRPAADSLVQLGAIALLGCATERARLLFAAPDVAEIDLRPALQAACAVIGGRGGGPPERVQAAGPRVEALAAALEAARTTLLQPGG